MQYMFTHSGKKIWGEEYPEGEEPGVPTIDDFAVQLGRIARFAGATKVWWSVLHHVFVCDRLLSHLHDDPQNTKAFHKLRLKLILHDAHEIITSDIPKRFKPPKIKRVQHILDERFFKKLGIGMYEPSERAWVKQIDHFALCAEAIVVGPPNSNTWGGPVWEDEKNIVREVAQEYDSPLYTTNPNGLAVHKFKKIVKELLDKIG